MALRIPLLLAGLALLTRLPFTTDNLWGWDSVLYVRAMERFDPAEQRPHPPGYLPYVVAARALNALVHDPNLALVVISVVAGAIAISLLNVVGTDLYGPHVGRLSALFLLTSVTFWAYGGVAYPYTLLAALSLLLALALWRATSQPSLRAMLLASGAYGLAAGVRPDLVFLFGPLWLLAAFRQRLSWALAGAALVAASGFGWLLLYGEATGGVERYLGAAWAQSDEIVATHSVFSGGLDAVRANLTDLARYLGRALYVVAAPLAVLCVAPRRARDALAARLPAIFLAVWILPALWVYAFVHVGDYGHVFTIVPALCLVSGRALVALVPHARRAALVGAALVTANAGVFLLSDTPLAAGDLARRDRGLAEKVAFVRTLPDPEPLVVSAYDALLVEHYLRKRHAALRADRKRRAEPWVCRAERCIVVVWDEILRVRGEAWTTLTLPSGAQLRVTSLRRGGFAAADDLSVEIEGVDRDPYGQGAG